MCVCVCVCGGAGTFRVGGRKRFADVLWGGVKIISPRESVVINWIRYMGRSYVVYWYLFSFKPYLLSNPLMIYFCQHYKVFRRRRGKNISCSCLANIPFVLDL